ncbi:hypothetical protein [Ekhidna sp.]|uniref:hypothetical protein n=1 Tax=Ekhidna sp. TaxID=2608089 RepID=UPI0035112464
MAIITINLTLDGQTLKYQDSSGNWQVVDAGNPSTGVNSGDEVDWVADDTISKVKIKPNQNQILEKVNDNDSKKPKGKVKNGLTGTINVKYTISVKPASGGGGYIDVDPDLHYPKGGD